MKIILTCLLMATILVSASFSAEACPRRRSVHHYYGRSSSTSTRYARVDRRAYYPSTRYYSYNRRPSYWQRHRDVLTTLIGAGTGAGIGAVAGGRKGAAIGALAGGGGAALYTYGLRDRRRRY